MEDLLKFLKCTADENRLKILKLLLDGKQCVCQLQELLDKSQSSISQHLSYFKELKLLEEEQKGKWIYYSLDRDVYDNFVAQLVTLKGKNLKELNLTDLAEKRNKLGSAAETKAKQKRCC